MTITVLKDLNQGFYTAATLLHFAKASAQMNIAPSALTRQIKLFEESVGESLFVRSNRKIILTSRGKEILELLKPLLSKHRSHISTLRVGGLAGVIDNHLWKVLKKILGSNDLQVSVFESTSVPALDGLLTGDLDLAFVNERVSNDLIQFFPLGKEEIVLISKTPISLKELGNRTWIFCGRGRKLKSISKTESLRQIKVSSLNKVLDLVEIGLGIGVVPISEKLSRRNFHVSALPIKNRETYLAVPRYERVPPLIQQIISDITDGS